MPDKPGFGYNGPGNTPGNGNPGGGSSGGSSSSSGPTTDPRIAQLESLMRSAYISLWGEPPTEGYVKSAAKSGMNTTEFVARERMKDAFQFTKTYKDESKAILDWMRSVGAA